jgi:protein-disulfide isomerase
MRLSLSGALVAVAIVATLAVDGHGSSHVAADEHRIDRAVVALLAGIPQHGSTLGKRTAPIMLEVFNDLEDPTSRSWFIDALPPIVEDYVRTGAIELRYHSFKTNTFWPAVFVKQQTAALAAGAQNRLWNFIDIFNQEQGAKYADYVTESFLDNIAHQVPGLNLAQWHADRGTGRREEQTVAEDHTAKALGLHVTPSFRIGPTGGKMENFVGPTTFRFKGQQHSISLIEASDIGKAIARLDRGR